MTSGDWKSALRAVQNGDIVQLKYYITEGVSINYEHPEIITTLLIEAIELNKPEIVSLLLENGADPKMKAGMHQMDALHKARHLGHQEIVDLIQKKNNENQKETFLLRLLKKLK